MKFLLIKKIADRTEYVFPYLKKYLEQQELREQFYENINVLQNKYFTYGGLNTDLLSNAYLVNGYNLEKSVVSATFDAQLELLMPDVWYLNGGEHFLNTALFFNRVQNNNEQKKTSKIKNKEIAETFGYFGLMEVYFRENTLERFKQDNIEAFSVLKTIPECARVLESDIYEDILKDGYKKGVYKKRLLSHIPAANYYYYLMKENQELIAGYDENNFHLGMAKTQEIIEAEGNSPVRRYFVDLWKNVLVKKGIDPEHSEIIVLGTKFSYNRNPDFVIVGENHKFGFQEKITDSNFAYNRSRKIHVRYKEPQHQFDLIKRNGAKWEWDPEVYLLSLILLNELGEEELYLNGLELYLSVAEK